ncbi:MAG TPA: hypothetical protein VD927_08125 [Chryseosolibacter sp.]|nr:hypothetical protein [Chryseosolibacter sp.]
MNRAFCITACVFATVLLSCGHVSAQKQHQPKIKTGSIGSKKQAKLLDHDAHKGGLTYQGIGFKLGDPFGFTYKFYADKKFSFVIDIGRVSAGLYNRYYREKFEDYMSIDTFTTDNASVQYITHKAKNDIVGEAKFLYHLEVSNITAGLQPYVGIGWQWKNTRLIYNYLYHSQAVEARPGEFTRKRLTMGPQIILGVEYAYFELPLSAFLEIEYFRDIQADPGWHRFEGGVGLRYIF